MRRTLGIVLVGSVLLVGCYKPFDLDHDGSADFAFVDDGDWYRVGEPDPFWSIDPDLTGLGDVPGDYDGEGGWEPAAVGPGVWTTGGDAGTVTFDYPGPGPLFEALAVPGDYDGDGDTDPALYDLDTGTWHLHAAPAVIDGGAGRDELGELADSPVPADFDGDGDTDLGVYSPTEGTITIPGQATLTDLPVGLPLTGELDGTPGIDLIFYQPVGTRWVEVDGTIIDPPGSPTDASLLPIVADHDGSGTDELVLYNTDEGVWTSVTGTVLASDARAAGNPATSLRSHTLFEFIRMAFIQDCLADPGLCD